MFKNKSAALLLIILFLICYMSFFDYFDRNYELNASILLLLIALYSICNLLSTYFKSNFEQMTDYTNPKKPIKYVSLIGAPEAEYSM